MNFFFPYCEFLFYSAISDDIESKKELERFKLPPAFGVVVSAFHNAFVRSIFMRSRLAFAFK